MKAKVKWVPWGPLLFLWVVATFALGLALEAVYDHATVSAFLEGAVAGATYSWLIGSAWAWQLLDENHKEVMKVLDHWKASLDRLERRS